MHQLLRELRRRNVFRVAAAYLVGAWLVLQVVDVLAPILEFPPWVSKLIFFLLLLGFVAAVILSWAYEITDKGLQREAEADHDTEAERLSGRKFDFAIIGLLTVAVTFLVLDNYLLEDPPWREPAVLTRSIAVLPFRNLSPAADDAYLAEGIHMSVLSQLARLDSFDRVVNRSSVEPYRDTQLPIPQIAAELDVTNVLAGTVRLAGNKVRIFVELINAIDKGVIWSETYDAELSIDTVFATENDIATKIVASLGLGLSIGEEQRLGVMPTDNLDAYREYVLGEMEMAKLETDALYRATEHFLNAIELDPTYSNALVGVATVLGLQGDGWFFDFYNNQPKYEQRRFLLDWALEFDPQNGLAYATLADMPDPEGGFEEREKLFRKAIELTPNAYQPHLWYAQLLARQERDGEPSRMDEVLQRLQKAREVAPNEPSVAWFLSWMLVEAGRHDESVELVLDAVKRSPGFSPFYRRMMHHHWDAGQLGEALRWAEAGRAINPDDYPLHLYLCQLYFRLADVEATQQCLDATRVWGKFFVHHVFGLFLQRGDREGARDFLASWRTDRKSDRAGPTGTGRIYSLPLDHLRFAYSWLSLGELQPALEVLQAVAPELFDDDGRFNGDVELDTAFESLDSLHVTTLSAIVLHEQGDTERANALFDAALAWQSETGPRSRDAFDPGALSGGVMALMPIHAVRQDREAVLRTLREGLDAGYLGWFGQGGPLFDFIRDDPGWIALMQRLDEMTAREWQWYEEHKSEPLF